MRAIILVLGVLLAATAAALETHPSTVTNLQRAFEAELNSATTFGAYAQRADRDGLPRVARVFRALALAEQAHARSHAATMRSLGARPQATIVEGDQRTTRENIEAAMARERFHLEAMYPTILGEALEVGDRAPVATLTVAMLVERAHLKLLDEALAALDATASPAGELCVRERNGHVSTASTCGPMAIGLLAVR